jgi:hypothetical protein
MKRISTPAPDENFNSLKPLIGTSGNPPFYDPNDVHVHIWKKGKLGVEDDPKIPTYSKEKINIRTCEYCKICHKIGKKFISSSNLSKSNEILKDYIRKNEETITDNYIIQNNHYEKIINVQILPDNCYILPQVSPIKNKMFKDKREVYNNCIKLCKNIN